MVYDAVRRTRPLLYLNVGDFFYGDVDRDDPDLYRRQYDSNLTAPAQAVLYASAPVAYTWGDHDFAGNDADGTAPGKPRRWRSTGSTSRTTRCRPVRPRRSSRRSPSATCGSC